MLQPYPAATIERAVERGLGTLAGSLVVVAITWLVHSPHALGVLMFAFATASVLVRARSYRLFVAFLTPVFVLVAEHLTSDWAIVATRLLDVAIGGALAVIATYAEHRAMLLRWRSGRCSSSSATST